MSNVPRMRTVPQAYRMLKEIDPGTAVTTGAIRQMISKGEIPVYKVGNKSLINFDLLLNNLSCYNDIVVCVPQKGVTEHG